MFEPGWCVPVIRLIFSRGQSSWFSSNNRAMLVEAITNDVEGERARSRW
jgi:hypothetical protein